MDPNKSLKTSVNIAIIMAVSEMAQSKEEESNNSYPLIFDAPISSFDKDKSSQFLNMLNSIPGQKIIMLKDFVSKEKGIVKIMDEFYSLSCNSSYLLSLKILFSIRINFHLLLSKSFTLVNHLKMEIQEEMLLF